MEIVGASGGRLPVLVNGTLKTDADGEPVVARLVLFDARERRAYEHELLAARRRAEESESRALELARTLQASLLPPELIAIDGYEIGAAFRPSGDGTVIGGDFYDLFRDHEGQAEVVLGDVCGKGPTAAVVAGLARYTTRALAAEEVAPAAVLAGVNSRQSVPRGARWRHGVGTTSPTLVPQTYLGLRSPSLSGQAPKRQPEREDGLAAALLTMVALGGPPTALSGSRMTRGSVRRGQKKARKMHPVQHLAPYLSV